MSSSEKKSMNANTHTQNLIWFPIRTSSRNFNSHKKIMRIFKEKKFFLELKTKENQIWKNIE